MSEDKKQCLDDCFAKGGLIPNDMFNPQETKFTQRIGEYVILVNECEKLRKCRLEMIINMVKGKK